MGKAEVKIKSKSCSTLGRQDPKAPQSSISVFRKGNYTQRGTGAAMILELAGNSALEPNKSRIILRHLKLTI